MGLFKNYKYNKKNYFFVDFTLEKYEFIFVVRMYPSLWLIIFKRLLTSDASLANIIHFMDSQCFTWSSLLRWIHQCRDCLPAPEEWYRRRWPDNLIWQNIRLILQMIFCITKQSVRIDFCYFLWFEWPLTCSNVLPLT